VTTAVWTGTLSFGLVSIPVKLYPATQPKDVRFHLVDPETGHRIRYKRVVEGHVSEQADSSPEEQEPSDDTEGTSDEDESPGTPPVGEREIAFEELTRGYEVEPGRLVTLSREEIDSIRPRRSRSIEIEDFVQLESIDPVYFEKSYYLAPQHEAEEPYVLLLRAMERTSLVGIGRFVLRTKPHLVAIRAMDEVLGLETMYFADEVRPPDEVAWNLSAVSVSSRELALAEQLIEMLRTEWEPSAYSDQYREQLLRMISERAPTLAQEERAPASQANVERLMEALKASVEAAKGRQRGLGA
jgi:DNA end-binding protein Ku